MCIRDRLWTGPWVIEKFFSPIVVQISHPLTHKRQTVHVDRLVPCLTPTELSSSVVKPEQETQPIYTPVLPPVFDTTINSADAGEVSQEQFTTRTRAGRTVRPPLRYM